MQLVQIDKEKCTKDGMCLGECSPAIIERSRADGYPEVATGNEEACLLCGHCVAVCPEGAITHRGIPIEDSPPIIRDLTIGEQQAVQFLRSRRSIRLYEERAVEKEKILRLIEVARYAPSAGNAQSVEWLVLEDRSEIRKIAGLTVEWIRGFLKKDPGLGIARPYLPRAVTAWESGRDPVLRGAPVVIVASAPAEAANGLVDLTLALSYLDLLAPTIGLGTCWAGLLEGALLSSPSLREIVGIPEGHPHHYPMMLGYPKAKYYRLPARKPPRITFR
ncbi:MAG: nitroreductase family protein [Syntrophorhabdales bacterium]|jgi:nitroreductase/NAD-dependent dihydropyrimidine dehydrogenase PreA subunit